MKKTFILLVALVATGLGARAQDWAIGGRMGSGLQVVGQRYLYNGNYIEARLGVGWNQGLATSEISAMHVWNVRRMDWSSRGEWFFDAGLGAMFGGAHRYFVCGVQGMARLGYEFDDAPVSISADWSPVFGTRIASHRVSGDVWHTSSSFNGRGFANLGVTCVYRF